MYNTLGYTHSRNIIRDRIVILQKELIEILDKKNLKTQPREDDLKEKINRLDDKDALNSFAIIRAYKELIEIIDKKNKEE